MAIPMREMTKEEFLNYMTQEECRNHIKNKTYDKLSHKKLLEFVECALFDLQSFKKFHDRTTAERELLLEMNEALPGDLFPSPQYALDWKLARIKAQQEAYEMELKKSQEEHHV